MNRSPCTKRHWDALEYGTYEIVVPTNEADLEIPWDVIRAFTDSAFNQYLADAADELKWVGLRITQLREERHRTIPDLASRAGIAPDHLIRIETGEGDVSMPTLQRIVAALNYSLRDFVVGVP